MRKRAESGGSQRDAILRRILDDNLRLAQQGYCRTAPAYSRTRLPRITKRGISAVAALPLALAAFAPASHELALPTPIEAHAAPKPAVVRAETTGADTVAAADLRSPVLPAARIAVSDAAPSNPDATEHVGIGEAPAKAAATEPTVRELFDLSVRTIVIDAGHGGRDPGAIGRTTGLREKDVTLDIAQRLKEKLARDTRYRILLVRDSDAFVSLKERAEYANARATDLFVSLHVNFLTGTAVNAVETYYYGHHHDPRTRMLAQHENRYSSYAISEFEHLLQGMQDSVKLHESQKLATHIQASLLGNIRRRNEVVLDTGVRTAPFAVLLGVKAPSVLTEIGNLSSPEAEQYLGDPGYRDAIAGYIARGIIGYLSNQPQEAEVRHVEVENRIAGR